MSTDENVAVLKEAYRSWHDTLGGSADHRLNLMTDDVQFRTLTERAETWGLPALPPARMTRDAISPDLPRIGR